MPELSQVQHSVLVGSVLGDANLHINSNAKNAYLKFVHGPKQLEYLHWKAAHFSEFFNTMVPYHWDNKWGRSYQLRTRSAGVFTKYHSLFYSRPRLECAAGIFPKRITPEILDSVDDIALAVWYGDDGSLNVEKKESYRNSMTLALGGLSRPEYSLIAEWFRSFVPVVRIKETRSNCVVLKFGAEGSEVLASRIHKHLPLCMAYKIKGVKVEVPHS